MYRVFFRMIFFLGCAVGLLFLGIPCGEATVYVDANASPGGDGNSWATAYNSLQQAITDADAADEAIWAAQGVYSESIAMATGVGVYAGFQSGDLSFNDRDPKAHLAIIDAVTAGEDYFPADHAVAFSFVTDATLDGFFITGAQGSEPYYPTGAYSGFGAGILCEGADSSNAVVNCLVSGNSAMMGGGIGCYQSDVLIDRCWIAGNGAQLGAGVACYDASPELSNCILSGNIAMAGGGLWTKAWAAPRLTNCTVASNGRYESFIAQTFGSGAYCDDTSPIFFNTIFADNERYGIQNSGYNAAPTVSNCLFYGNKQGDYYDPTLLALKGANEVNLEAPAALDNRDGNPKFLMGAEGAWTADPVWDSVEFRTKLTDTGASFTPNALAGKMIRADGNSLYEYLITGNTATEISVAADLSYSSIQSGSPYLIVDYHLMDDSAALDRASAFFGTAKDIDGETRPGGDSLYDIGADEALAVYEPPADATPPVSLVEGLPNYTATSVLDVPFRASDAETGVLHVKLYYRKGTGSWTQYGGTFASSPISFDSGATGGDGTYEFYTLATDNSTNTESAKSVADDSTRVFGTFAGARVYVDMNATGAETGDNWANAFRTIDVGIFVANAFASAEVWIADGTYTENIAMMNSVLLYGGFEGVESDLSERTPQLHKTVIDGDQSGHVISMDNVSGTRLDTLIITNGLAFVGTDGYGGGIHCYNANATNTIADCFIIHNEAAAAGGGVSCSHSSPVLQNCEIVQNNASEGGGMFIENGSPTISSCEITDNQAVGYDALGGGVTFRNATSPIVLNTMFSGNSAGWCGGGAYIYNSSPSFKNCVFKENTTEWGGAAMVSTSSAPAFVNCDIVSNLGSCCGGIFAYYQGMPELINTIFAANINYAVVTYGQIVPVTNCLFFNNTGADYYRYGFPLYTGAAEINASISGSVGTIDGDPQFVDVGAGDYQLSNLSPCVDAGTSLDAPSTDKVGSPRPHDVPGRGADETGAEYDIGAFENQDLGLYTPTETPTPSFTPTYTFSPTPTNPPSSSVGIWEDYR